MMDGKAMSRTGFMCNVQKQFVPDSSKEQTRKPDYENNCEPSGYQEIIGLCIWKILRRKRAAFLMR